MDAEYSFDGGTTPWIELKAGKFSDAEQLSVDIYSASPGGGHVGFKAVLYDLTIEQTEYCDDDDDDDDEEEDEPALESEDVME